MSDPQNPTQPEPEPDSPPDTTTDEGSQDTQDQTITYKFDFLDKMEGLSDTDKLVMQQALVSQSMKIDELSKQLEKFETENVSIKKAQLINEIKKAGFKTKGFESYSVDQLEAIAQTLKQSEDSIIINPKPAQTEPRKTMIWDNEKKALVPEHIE